MVYGPVGKKRFDTPARMMVATMKFTNHTRENSGPLVRIVFFMVSAY